MGTPVIQARGIGKQYRLGAKQEKYYNLRDTLAQMIMAPVRRILKQDGGHGESSDTLWALKDITLDVDQGEVLGIIGRNGAGKTSLLRILSRVTAPTTGEVFLSGRVGSLLEVGTGFHPELTGRENIYLNGSILGMRKGEIDKKFDEIVDFSGIERFLDTPMKRYSSGMQVRLAFSIAAHLDTEILLVDEVLTVGDADFQNKSLGKMDRVAREGRTVLIVSHNVNAIEDLCHSVMLLESGVIRERSTDVRSVIKNYLFGEEGSANHCLWENSDYSLDNDWFRPVLFKLTDAAGCALSMPVRNDSDIQIQIEGELKQYDPAFNVGVALYNEEGRLLFLSYTTDAPEHRWPKFDPGYIKIRSSLPKRFLNEGSYRIELIATLHLREWLCEPGRNAPSVVFRIQGGLSDSPYWTFGRPGLLAPALEWKLID